jgi:hypothetical protein
MHAAALVTLSGGRHNRMILEDNASHHNDHIMHFIYSEVT